MALMIMMVMAVPTYAAAKISSTKVTLCTGQTKQLKVTGTSAAVKWSSSSTSVATVASNGKVTAKKKGTATITAKAGSKSYKCKVTVENPKLSKTSITISKGKTYTLKMSGTSSRVTWKSSKTSVATVSSKGKVTAKKAGTTVVSAAVNGKKFNCRVVVKGSASSSKGKVSVTGYATDKGVVAIVKNGCSYSVNVTVDCMFYNNGKAVKNGSDSNYALEAGRTCALRIYNTSAAWTSFKLNTKYSKASSNIITNASKITYTANKGANNHVVAVFKNKGKAVKFTQVACVFYKNGRVVGYHSTYADVDTSGSTDYVTFYCPTDSNYDYINYDSYKIYVNNSYKYSWQK